MKQLILLVCLVFVALAAARHPKHKNHHQEPVEVEEAVVEEEEQVPEEPKRRQRPSEVEEEPILEDEDEKMVEEDEKQTPTVAPIVKTRVQVEIEPEVQQIAPKETPTEHPCNKHHCGKGKECVLDEDDKPKCICTKKCGVEKDARFKVCSTMNDTFASMCEMDRQVCLCKKREEGCINPHFRNAELDYYGPCKDMDDDAKACTPYEKEQFPIRMRQWLYIVMEELAERNDLQQHAKQMARKAEHMKKANKKDDSNKWVIPVMWKFCDLDTSHDEVIAPLEHLPISAPLKPLEHCFSPFLLDCDADDDNNITKHEWMTCLNLKEDDIAVTCKEFRDE